MQWLSPLLSLAILRSIASVQVTAIQWSNRSADLLFCLLLSSIRACKSQESQNVRSIIYYKNEKKKKDRSEAKRKNGSGCPKKRLTFISFAWILITFLLHVVADSWARMRCALHLIEMNGQKLLFHCSQFHSYYSFLSASFCSISIRSDDDDDDHSKIVSKM